METINGTNGDESLYGTDADEFINAKKGDDSILAGGGVDSVLGAEGDDTIVGGWYDNDADTMDGGAGDDWVVLFSNDVARGGDGVDALVLNLSNADGALTLDLNNLTSQTEKTLNVGTLEQNVTVSGFEFVLVNGSQFNDKINIGNALSQVNAGAGNDTVTGGSGDDYVRLGAGNDVFNAGKGYDRVGYFGVEGGVHVSLLLQGQAQDTGQGLDKLTGVEHVSGTYDNDVLIGDGNDNWLWGMRGDDSLVGNGGDDLLSVSPGQHTLIGGSGVDTVDLLGNTTDYDSGVFVSLLKQDAAQNTGFGQMYLSGIENLSGTIHEDVLLGDANANVLAGVDGDDLLLGGGGSDMLLGDGCISTDNVFGTTGPIATFQETEAPGADTLNGGAGADTIIGGYGQDEMTGGKGADTFKFLSILDSTNGAADYIVDLSNKQDVIDLSAIDAKTASGKDDKFVLVASLTGKAGQAELHYDAANDVTTLKLDVNGGGADFTLEIAGDHSDFSNFVL